MGSDCNITVKSRLVGLEVSSCRAVRWGAKAFAEVLRVIRRGGAKVKSLFLGHGQVGDSLKFVIRSKFWKNDPGKSEVC